MNTIEDKPAVMDDLDRMKVLEFCNDMGIQQAILEARAKSLESEEPVIFRKEVGSFVGGRFIIEVQFDGKA